MHYSVNVVPGAGKDALRWKVDSIAKMRPLLESPHDDLPSPLPF